MSKNSKNHDPYLDDDDDCTCEIAFTGHCESCRRWNNRTKKESKKS